MSDTQAVVTRVLGNLIAGIGIWLIWPVSNRAAVGVFLVAIGFSIHDWIKK